MWNIYALEIILIVSLIIIFSQHGIVRLTPSVIAIVVGVHFFPLGGVFRYMPYYIVGILLVAIGLAGGTLFEDWQWLIGSFTGLILLIGSLIRRRS